jgi:hypothetical protein
VLGPSGSCGFCPAGSCTSLKNTSHAKDLNHSVSPIDIKSEEDKDKEIEDHEIEEEEVEAEEEKHEGEVVKPPVDESG